MALFKHCIGTVLYIHIKKLVNDDQKCDKEEETPELYWCSSHYAVTHMCNKNSIIQGRSPNVVKVIFHTIRNCSLRKECAPSGSKLFSVREVPILKRGAIEENHCLIQ